MARFLVDRGAPPRLSWAQCSFQRARPVFVPWSIAPSGSGSTGRQADTAGCRGRYWWSPRQPLERRRPEEDDSSGRRLDSPPARVELARRIGHRPETQREIAMATAVVNTLDGLDRELETVLTSFDTSYAWNYGSVKDGLRDLYEKAKREQWNSTTQLAWDTHVDPDGEIVPAGINPLKDYPPFQ